MDDENIARLQKQLDHLHQGHILTWMLLLAVLIILVFRR